LGQSETKKNPRVRNKLNFNKTQPKMKSVNLISCQTPFEANLIKARLEDAGIPSFLTNENYSTLYPVMGNLFGAGVKVMVNEEDFEKAMDLLGEELKDFGEEDNQ
jgi:hypothetical protein